MDIDGMTYILVKLKWLILLTQNTRKSLLVHMAVYSRYTEKIKPILNIIITYIYIMYIKKNVENINCIIYSNV